MFNLVLPIAGKSSRFENVRPKFLLVHPNGNLMITESIRGLYPEQFDKIIIIGLQEYQQKYNYEKAIILEFTKELKIPRNKIINVFIKSTNSQPETIYRGLKKICKLKGGILIKDCDNYFELKSKYENNFIAVGDLHKLGKINASNKSYVNIGKKNTVVNIVEKEIIGNKFCCGGYYFEDTQEFIKYYEKLAHYKNLYISHIIYKMILDGKLFFTEEVNNYVDWGTLEDWLNYTKQFATIFVDLDGVLVENSGRHFKPQWGQTKAIKENIEVINKLYDTKKVHIIITTARLETPMWHEITKNQLEDLGIKYHRLIMGLPHAQRIIINDYSLTNPYPVSIAVNLERNISTLKQLLKL